MRDHQLTRGNQIQSEISELEYALIGLTKLKMFYEYGGSCGSNGRAITFLSSLETDAKNELSKEIQSKISHLKGEFELL